MEPTDDGGQTRRHRRHGIIFVLSGAEPREIASASGGHFGATHVWRQSGFSQNTEVNHQYIQAGAADRIADEGEVGPFRVHGADQDHDFGHGRSSGAD